MEHIGLEQARPKLGEIVDLARLASQHTIITRQGQPAAAVVPINWRDGMRELRHTPEKFRLAGYNDQDMTWTAAVRIVCTICGEDNQPAARTGDDLSVNAADADNWMLGHLKIKHPDHMDLNPEA